MEIFFSLSLGILPLYALIFLGWVACRAFAVDVKSLGSLGVYIFMPIAVFGCPCDVLMMPHSRCHTFQFSQGVKVGLDSHCCVNNL